MYICCISITTGICSKIYLKFLFSYSMTGAWRWSGHPISWKQTLSLHLWVDINLIYLYCICILIFARLEKKSPEFPLERCSNSRQSAKPRLRTSSPVIRSIKTYHLLSSNHINNVDSTYQNKTSAFMPALSTIATFCGSLDCQYLCP